MQKSGQITVFMALILTILLSVFLSVIGEARANAMQFQIECVTDIAMQSILAEYNRELLGRYDLFFVDTAYGKEQGANTYVEDHIRKYMEDNFNESSEHIFVHPSDLLGLSADSVKVLRTRGASDGDGEEVMNQAAAYMADRLGLDFLAEASNQVELADRKNLLGDQIIKKRESNEKKIRAVDTRVKKKDGSYETVEINNPADQVNKLRSSSGILSLVVRDGDIVSGKKIDIGRYISHRGYKEREGFPEEARRIMDGKSLLFDSYLLEKCGNYVTPRENSYIKYQAEYILAGKGSDADNLKWVVNRLLLLRETANFAYIMTDSRKIAEAEALALTLSAVILFPELEELIKYSILLAWSYAESMNDVKILLAGGKAPLIKTAETWRLSLEHAMSMQLSNETMAGSGEKGLTYQQYLRILFAITSEKDKKLRFMDIVEMDLRQTTDNQYFCMDNCVDKIEAFIQVSGKNGRSYQITRKYGYEK